MMWRFGSRAGELAPPLEAKAIDQAIVTRSGPENRTLDIPRKSGEFLMKDEEYEQAADVFEEVRGGSRSAC
jgi:hypothetical protein